MKPPPPASHIRKNCAAWVHTIFELFFMLGVYELIYCAFEQNTLCMIGQMLIFLSIDSIEYW
jgi:hypothetical protein